MKNLFRIEKKSEHSERILYVAYPLLSVTESSGGGAEQVLQTVERGAHQAGFRTTVAAAAHSEVAGSLYATGAPAAGSLRSTWQLEQEHAACITEMMHVRSMIGMRFALVHDHSGSFFSMIKKPSAPVLATLHLPRSFYPRHFFSHLPENIYFNCVSGSQAEGFSDVKNVIGVVENGIELGRFPMQAAKSPYLLWLGRICEEKGAHLALDAAARAGLPIILAGTCFPLEYHRAYFRREVAPRLSRMGSMAKFVDTPDFATKTDLLKHARAVLLPSTCEETSSLVAMEAAACGTPVIAFDRGALPEVVHQGETGLIVRSMPEMADAVPEVARIKPRACRDHAHASFSSQRMVEDYIHLYDALTSEAVELHSQPQLSVA